MSSGTNVILAVIASIAYLLLIASNSVSAQNMTNQTITGGNMTNAPASGAGGSAKMHIEEAIKALESGNNEAASTHLTAAQQGIASEPDQAKMHFSEAMKAFSSGDLNGALMHLKATNDALS